MGLARGAIALLLEEGKARPFRGRVVTLGRQTIYASGGEVLRQFRKFGVQPQVAINPGAAQLDDVTFFNALGFENVTSLDYSDFEGATHVVDLNQLGMPTELQGQFDAVVDSGTLEHIFHVPNAMQNAMSMAKIGGRVIFLSPSSNHLDHGFYMFSPTFFSDYFAANRFRIEKIYVVRYSGNMDDMWDAYQYEPGKWREFHIGGLDAAPYAVYVVATRTPEATTDGIPQQGYYARTSPAYSGFRVADGSDGSLHGRFDTSSSPPLEAVAATPRAFRQRLKALVCKVPGGLMLARRLERGMRSLGGNSWRSPSNGGIQSKKLIGRY